MNIVLRNEQLDGDDISMINVALYYYEGDKSYCLIK